MLRRLLRAAVLGLILGSVVFWWSMDRIGKERIEEVRERVTPGLSAALAGKGFQLGNPAFIRIFKESSELELWLQPDPDASFRLFKTWPVANWSGKLGPKLAEGDYQAPEGFYVTDKSLLNPRSAFHLSFNIGFPNAFDRAHDRTGSFIMVHGSDVSIGCFAMTDPVIEEIYLIVEAALDHGQSNVPIHTFPFRMIDERLEQTADSDDEHPWLDFWTDLRPIHDAFEADHQIPNVQVENKRHILP